MKIQVHIIRLNCYLRFNFNVRRRDFSCWMKGFSSIFAGIRDAND